MAKFENLRISLGRPGAPPIIEQLRHEERYLSRREYLERAFGQSRDFVVDGRIQYRFVPIEAPSDYLAGFFGRHVRLPSFKKVDLSPQALDGWDRSLFVLHLGSDQLCWMEHAYKVGSPRKVIAAFLKNLRLEDGFRDYEPHVEYIINPETYWRVIARYAGRINKIEFTFIPPNALQSEEAVMEFIKEASAEASSSIIKHTYESEQGKLNAKAGLLEGSAKVAMNGGGEILVQADNKTVFKTSNSVKIEQVPKDHIPEEGDLKKLLLLIGRLFG